MKQPAIHTLLCALVACGAAQAGSPHAASDPKTCAILKSGIVDKILRADAPVTYRPGTGRNDFCIAKWERPDKAERSAAYQAQIRKWATDPKRSEKMPSHPNLFRSVDLTIADRKFKSPHDAVVALESSVKALNKGVAVEIEGRKHTVQLEAGKWIDGVGDRAVERNPNGIQVAHRGMIFTVHVNVADDVSENQRLAVAVAKRVAQAL
jgi:hypothetical protein